MFRAQFRANSARDCERLKSRLVNQRAVAAATKRQADHRLASDGAGLSQFRPNGASDAISEKHSQIGPSVRSLPRKKVNRIDGERIQIGGKRFCPIAFLVIGDAKSMLHAGPALRLALRVEFG